jgi:hypothetical protein
MSNTPTPNGAAQAAAGELGKANSTAMVTVGCKLPNGLICEMGKVGDENHTVVRLNGANSARVIGGYGLTQVSAEFWGAWVKKHKGLEFVRKGLVFAHGDEASAGDHAKDVASTRTGFEAIDPTKKILGADGQPLLETDMSHFNQARADVAQFGGARR